ncbi:MAG: hypothetical protein IPQ09_21520 [Myxococcales bacterium]|nr:hypothetical protein [Myxococcales bacterium]
MSAPLSRGIFVTSFAKVDASVPKEAIAEAFAAAYAGEPFVRVPQKRLPEVVAVSGSNYAEVAFEHGADTAGLRIDGGLLLRDGQPSSRAAPGRPFSR